MGEGNTGSGVQKVYQSQQRHKQGLRKQQSDGAFALQHSLIYANAAWLKQSFVVTWVAQFQLD
jgi:hypothetical protein